MSHRPLWPAILLGLLTACASAPLARTGTAALGGKTRIEDAKPDTAGVLSLLGRWGAAHACPIVTPSGCNAIVLTAAHVVDPRPFDDVPLLPYRYSDGYGSSGVLEPVATERCADLATMRLGPGADVRPYRRAALAPEAGGHVWFVGYEWSSKSKAFSARTIRAKVVRVVAGHLVLDPAGEAGSSGSCVLNQAGEVVGINVWGRSLRSGEEVGGAVGIWGSWLEACR